MSNINQNIPAIHEFDDLTLYTGNMTLPFERPEIRQEKVAKGEKLPNKEISGVTWHKWGSRSGTPCWRIDVYGTCMKKRKVREGEVDLHPDVKVGERPEPSHPRFTYECQTREEAAYIATMAHRLLKPWFFQQCQRGVGKQAPARPGDSHYLWNDIWGLWKYAMVDGDNGERFFAAAVAGAMRCFITDCRPDIYAAMVRAPFFYRTTINQHRNLEPAQPHVYLDEEGKARVRWIRISEIVLGPEAPPIGVVNTGRDFRAATLRGEKPPLPFKLFPEAPNGWRPLTEPYRFNAIHPIPGESRFHPYARN